MYLRTNYRLTGKELDADAFGKGIKNVVDGSSVNPDFFGGLIIGSWALEVPPTTSGVIPLSAYGEMRSYFGATQVSNVWGSGFKIQPVFVFAKSFQSTSGVFWQARPAFSYSSSIVFISAIRGSAASVPTIIASTASIAFYYVGFIVSTPWT